MEKLLKWSLNASNPQEGPDGRSQEIKQPDPELLSQLFGGPDDSQLMKQSVEAAKDTSLAVDVRETALDNLEMLVENLDNANNMQNLGLWGDVVSLLDDPEPIIRRMACWIIGTAVQNNDKSQNAFTQVKLENGKTGIQKLVSISFEDPDNSVRIKALYALSSLLQHHDEGYKQFEETNGWDALKRSLEHEPTHLKALSLLNTAVGPSPAATKLDKVTEHQIVPHALQSADSNHSNTTAQEKALQFLWTLRNSKYPFSAQELNQVENHRNALLQKDIISADDYPM